MKVREIISEAPLQDYEPLGDFKKQGSFNDPRDKKLIQNPVHTQTVFKFFENTDYDFRIFPVNVPGLRQYTEKGVVSPEFIQNMFVKQPEIAEKILESLGGDNITIVYVSNTGTDKIPLTPWMMAHRFGHAVNSSNLHAWKETEKYLFNGINEALEDIYDVSVRGGVRGGFNMDNSKYYNALFNVIGTQRSSRRNLITRPYEFLYELFAQYLESGTVQLNPLPRVLPYGKAAWGRKDELRANSDYTDSDLEQYAASLANTMDYSFDTVLGQATNSIFVM